MSFASTKEDALPAFKSFVTEDELEEKRKKRQEEWEKVRKPDEPLEAPEEEYDSRSLFEQLQDQKNKKQEEFEEQLRLKNQVKGLEEDEVEFLDYVSQRQMELDAERSQEDSAVINEYKEARASQVVDRTKPTEAKSLRPSASAQSTRKSQQALLAGAVKRKSVESIEETKKRKLTEASEEAPNLDSKSANFATSQATVSQQAKKDPESTPASKGHPLQVIGILPGIGEYTDSSDSNSSSEESDVEVETLGLHARMVKHIHGLGCSHPH